MERVFIYGAGSVGGHIVSNPELYGLENTEVFFLDDDITKIGSMFINCQVVGGLDYLLSVTEGINVVIGIAFPNIKAAILSELSGKENIKFPTLIAKNSWISNEVQIGEGTIIYPNSSVNYACIIDKFVTINMNCSIGHHSSIGKFSSLAPGVCFGGYTKLGTSVDCGIGSATKQGVEISDNSVIGGQTFVTKSFPANSRIIGIPGRNILKNEKS